MSRQARLWFVRNAFMNRPGRVLLNLVVGLALASIVPSAVAEQPFTVGDLSGVYGFSAAGTILPPALPAATPAVAVGTLIFDGNGGCSISDTINIGGTSASRTSTACSYIVSADGTGSISALFPGDLFPTPLSFVIVNREREIRFIRTDLGVASGVAKKQARHD